MSDPNESFAVFLKSLRESQFLSALDENSLVYLGKQAKQIYFQKDMMIFAEGESSKGLYWLHSGTLKAVKYSTSGREQILHLIKRGQTFNEVGAFTTLPNPVSVVALTRGHLWCIPSEVIRQLIEKDPDFAQAIINVLADRLRNSVTLIEDLSLRSVIGRLSRLILDEAEGEVLLRPSWYTQNELAARLGTVADVVQRALRKLEADELIEVKRQRIRIINRVELENLAD